MPRIAEPLLSYEDIPHRKRWMRRECDVLLELGILDGRDELVDGQVIIRSRYTPSHSVTIVLLRTWLVRVFGPLFVMTRGPILVAENEAETNDVEPAAAVTALPNTEYMQRHPSSKELLLVVEVSDSTLRFDRTVKAPLYARANIVEYWIIDIAGRQVFVHRRPEPGGYAEVTVYAEDERAATLARPNDAVRVAHLLPPVNV